MKSTAVGLISALSLAAIDENDYFKTKYLFKNSDDAIDSLSKKNVQDLTTKL